jgi:hypothetical protein
MGDKAAFTKQWDHVLKQVIKIGGVFGSTEELPPEWPEFVTLSDRYAARGIELPPEPEKEHQAPIEEDDEEVVEVDLHTCEWMMPVQVKDLERQIEKEVTKIRKARDAFIGRWGDRKTGKIVAPVKAVYNLGTTLTRWNLSKPTDRQMEKFVGQYEDGKRPLPKGRYEEA